MNELIAFLTSKEIIVVYVITGVACLLCLAVYLVEKNNEKFRRRHNTKELNKLVEQIKEEFDDEEKPDYEEPIIETIKPSAKKNVQSVVELLDSTAEMQKVEKNKVEEEQVRDVPLIITSVQGKMENLANKKAQIIEDSQSEKITNELEEEPVMVEKEPVVIEKEQVVDETKEEVELQYTSIEPDQVTAKLELEKLTKDLKKQEKEETTENIALTSYEELQEENAIISLEELVKKSKEMYAANELSQYVDEGNEPISLQDLERQMGNVKNSSYDEPFIIENVVPKEELVKDTTNVVSEAKPKMVLDDFKTIKADSKKEEVSSVTSSKKFQNSPIISPIYGIEKFENVSKAELELENTANYDKLDEEIRKTNEFLMTLKELQKKLD